MASKIKLGIIFGGRSGEHVVSLMSATSVIRAVDKQKYDIICIGITRQGRWMLYEGPVENIENGQWEEIAQNLYDQNPNQYAFDLIGTHNPLKDKVDVVFPVLHGPYGEDGTIQGLFEMADIPYVGAGVLGSVTAMDKACSKVLFERENLPICDYTVIFRKDFEEDPNEIIAQIEKDFDYPVFIKPANLGSSVGISKAHNPKELLEGLLEACRYDRKIIIEEFINCREIETGVMGNDNPKAAAVGEIIPSKEFYDYEAKYFDGGKSKICIPANIKKEQEEKIRALAIDAYKALDCCGFARVDFFISKETEKIYINEINTIPGFTAFSMFPLLWEEEGVEYSKLIDKLIAYALEKYEEKSRNALKLEVEKA
ncbi:MAG: D-alanine--D-alanine ligase [Clostridia bacterium]|nr:D-alanine--D-alanine ligase [Clostridia bacterium]